MLARREAPGERCGMVVRRTAACRWLRDLADDTRRTDTFGSAADAEDGADGLIPYRGVEGTDTSAVCDGGRTPDARGHSEGRQTMA